MVHISIHEIEICHEVAGIGVPEIPANHIQPATTTKTKAAKTTKV